VTIKKKKPTVKKALGGKDISRTAPLEGKCQWDTCGKSEKASRRTGQSGGGRFAKDVRAAEVTGAEVGLEKDG